MTVWVVKTYDYLYGVYATEELAKDARDYANYCEEMSGGRGRYVVKEMNVQTETKKVPEK